MSDARADRQSPSAWRASDFSVDMAWRGDGSLILRPRATLGAYPVRLTDALERWAAVTPDAVLIAERGADGDWMRLTYDEALRRTRRIAEGLARLELSAERPIAILSGNGIDHLLLGLAAMYVGVPYCPVSPAYSQASSDLAKLRYVMGLLTPGLVAAFGAGPFERAIAACVPDGAAVVGDALHIPGRRVLALADLEAAPGGAAATAHARTSADTIAKFLLTSGSTGQPKAVITTQRMLCSNQAMIRQAVPFVADEPPVIVDWLPWNHTFGGSHNVGLVLFNGGTLYVDEGKPVAQRFAETLRNLREIAPTIYLSVPKGFDLLARHLRRDAALCRNFYGRLRACFFAGAGLAQHTWDELEAIALSATGTRVPMLSGLGATETSPSVTFTTPETDRAGVIGLPAAGNLVKLAPVGDKLELRVRGPNVMPGYWREPHLTAQAFDDEGFYRLGDAVRLRDPADANLGLCFDGRIAEDFKLDSGTWVSVGPLRAALITALAPVAHDVVIAGLNRDNIGVLILPDLPACAAVADSTEAGDRSHVLRSEKLRRWITERLAAHARAHPGSSTSVSRAVLLEEPASLDHGEITDKGSVNQRAVLERRAALVEALYADEPGAEVLIVG